jgi:NAD(P)-dependent dehydrogenase (short-subunit alcohol dehydrogenase family)
LLVAEGLGAQTAYARGEDPRGELLTDDNGPRAALVTGAAQGIGLATAFELAKRGYVVYAADIDEEQLAAAVRVDSTDKLDIRPAVFDISDVDAATEAIRRCDREVPIVALVNNAGVRISGPITAVTQDEYDWIMSINVRGAFFALQAAASLMKGRGEGSIVNLASTSAFVASSARPMACYDISKASLKMLTVSAARELAPYGIRVNAVAPGTISTPTSQRLAGGLDALESRSADRIPLGRIGEASEIARAIAFLVSDEASYMTGHTLVVDGGWLT